MLTTLLLLTAMLVFCRAHYSIDIFGGYVFGHYFWMLAEKWTWVVDYHMLKIPFHKRFPNFRRKCFKCSEPINQWAVIMLGEKIIVKNEDKKEIIAEIVEEEEKRDRSRLNTISSQGKEEDIKK
jgi:hypothetical protein